jgi:hypothetical protein
MQPPVQQMAPHTQVQASFVVAAAGSKQWFNGSNEVNHKPNTFSHYLPAAMFESYNQKYAKHSLLYATSKEQNVIFSK